MKLESPSFSNGARIPEHHSGYGDNRSPELRWSGAPAGTKSFAIVVDDPDAPGSEPFVHWLIYNIPSALSALPESLPTSATLPDIGGALQGRNSAGSSGYFGPRPPKTHPPHHYHFRIVALDTMLPLVAGVDRNKLSHAMKGHALAEAETIGTYKFGGS